MTKALSILSKILYAVILTILLAALGFVLTTKYVLKNDGVSILGYRVYSIMSGSMEPTFNIGDIIITKHVDADDINVDDIITFRDEDDLTVTHRVIAKPIINGVQYYQTKGDNNNIDDDTLLQYDDIYGKYVSSPSRLFSSAPIVSGFILVLAILVTFDLISRKYNEDEED